jgi:hypothetical protein
MITSKFILIFTFILAIAHLAFAALPGNDPRDLGTVEKYTNGSPDSDQMGCAAQLGIDCDDRLFPMYPSPLNQRGFPQMLIRTMYPHFQAAHGRSRTCGSFNQREPFDLHHPERFSL